MNDALVDVPWELLFDGKDFLSLRFNMGRVVSTKQPVHTRAMRSTNQSLRMWIVADPRSDLEHAYHEGVELRDVLDQFANTLKVDLKTSTVDVETFKLNVRDYDILHYAGHAYYDALNPEKSGFLLQGNVFSARDALELVGERPLPTVVFANACQSGHSQPWQAGTGISRQVYGMANAFLLAGVRHFIGTLFRVGDKESKDFASYFYGELLTGASIGTALRQARLKMVKQDGYESIGWACYVLYGDPTYQLFAPTGGVTSDNLSASKISLHRRFRLNKRITILASLISVLTVFLVPLVTQLLRYPNLAVKPSLWPLAIKSFYSQQPISPQNIIPSSDYLNLVVLPFSDNGSSNLKIEFGEEIADSIQSLVRNIPDMVVYEGAKVDALKLLGREKLGAISSRDAIAIGKALRLASVLTGTFSQRDGKLNLDAKTLHSRTGETIQDTKVEGEVSNAEDLVSLLSKKIEAKLRLKHDEAWNDYGMRQYREKLPDKALSLFAKANNLFSQQKYNEAKRYYDEILQMVPDYPAGLFQRARIEQLVGNYTQATEGYQKAITAATTLANYPAFVASYIALGDIYIEKANFNQARMCYEKAIELARKINYSQGLSNALIRTSNLEAVSGHYSKAIELIKNELEWARLVDSYEIEAGLLLFLGLRYTEMGNFKQAEAYLSEARQINQRYRYWTYDPNQSSAYLESKRGNYKKAIEYIEPTLEVIESNEAGRGRLRTYSDLGINYFLLGDNQKAKYWFEKAGALSTEFYDTQKLSLTSNHYWHSLVARRDGQLKVALDSVRKSFALANQYQFRLEVGRALTLQADILADLGELETAESTCRDGLTILQQETEAVDIIMEGYNTLAKIYLKKGSLKEAELMAGKVYELYQHSPFREPYEQYLLIMGAIRTVENKLEEAKAFYLKGLELEKLSPSAHTAEFRTRLQVIKA